LSKKYIRSAAMLLNYVPQLNSLNKKVSDFLAMFRYASVVDLRLSDPSDVFAEQNRDIKMAKRCFENVAQFRYLGTTITNENLIEEEIKRRLNSGNACYHSVQNLLSSRLLSKNIKM
jgi:hypothetical protein